jgi:hypothetical protein
MKLIQLLGQEWLSWYSMLFLSVNFFGYIDKMTGHWKFTHTHKVEDQILNSGHGVQPIMLAFISVELEFMDDLSIFIFGFHH